MRSKFAVVIIFCQIFLQGAHAGEQQWCVVKKDAIQPAQQLYGGYRDDALKACRGIVYANGFLQLAAPGRLSEWNKALEVVRELPEDLTRLGHQQGRRINMLNKLLRLGMGLVAGNWLCDTEIVDSGCWPIDPPLYDLEACAPLLAGSIAFKTLLISGVMGGAYLSMKTRSASVEAEALDRELSRARTYMAGKKIVQYGEGDQRLLVFTGLKQLAIDGRDSSVQRVIQDELSRYPADEWVKVPLLLADQIQE